MELTEIKLVGGPADGVTDSIPDTAEEIMVTAVDVTADQMAAELAVLSIFGGVGTIETHLYRKTDRMELDPCPIHGAHGGWIFEFVESRPLDLSTVKAGLIGPF